MNIINSQPSDLQTIFHFYDLAVAYQKKVFNKHWEGFSQDLITIEIAENRQYKILTDENVAGIFAVTFNDPAIWKERDHDAIYIHRIVTHPDYRGSSLVNQIVQWAKQYAKENDLKYVRMDTWADNAKLSAYYVNCGFTLVGTVSVQDTDDLPKHYEGISLNLFEIAV